MGAGLLIPSFILASDKPSIDDKFTMSKILQHLVIEREDHESTSLFGELAKAFDVSETDIVRCVELLQEMQIITCFRDMFNVGGDMSLYVGMWTREAYLKEFDKIME